MSDRIKRDYGSGSISKRADGTWTARIQLGPGADGKNKVKAFYGKTEAEVKKKLKDYKAEAAKNDYINVKKDTIAHFFTEWLENTKRNELKDTSYDRLEVTVNNQIIPIAGTIQLASFTTADAQKVINTLVDTGYSYSTIKKTRDAMNDCFNHAVISRVLPFNPLLGVTMPAKDKFDEKDVRFFTKDEVIRLYDACRKEYKDGKRVYRIGEFVVLTVNTGLRLAELLALKWEDIDFTEGNENLAVDETRVLVKDRSTNALSKYKVLEQKSGKSKKSIRHIPLNSDALEALKQLKTVTGEFKYVLATEEGRPVMQRYVDRTFRNIEKAAGFDEDHIYGLHSLRHTFATLLLYNNTDIKTVSDLLGHSDTNITLNTYIHVIEEVKRKAVTHIEKVSPVVIVEHTDQR